MKDSGELDVGTKSGQNAVNDSTKVQQEKKKIRQAIKQVDQKK